MKKLPPGTNCVTCQERERQCGSYCYVCRNQRARKRYQLIQAGLVKVGPARGNGSPKTACNCGNAVCNGLMCERVSA